MAENRDVEERLRQHFATAALRARVPAGSRADVLDRARRVRRRRHRAAAAVVAVFAVAGVGVAIERGNTGSDTVSVASAGSLERLGTVTTSMTGGERPPVVWQDALWAPVYDASGQLSLGRSEDGLRWQEMSVPIDSSEWLDIATNTERLVVVGVGADQRTVTASTDDGRTWRTERVVDGRHGTAALTWTGRTFLLVTQTLTQAEADRVDADQQFLDMLRDRFGDEVNGYSRMSRDDDGNWVISVTAGSRELFRGTYDELGVDQRTQELLERAPQTSEPTSWALWSSGTGLDWTERLVPAELSSAVPVTGDGVVAVVDGDNGHVTTDGEQWLPAPGLTDDTTAVTATPLGTFAVGLEVKRADSPGDRFVPVDVPRLPAGAGTVLHADDAVLILANPSAVGSPSPADLSMSTDGVNFVQLEADSPDNTPVRGWVLRPTPGGDVLVLGWTDAQDPSEASAKAWRYGRP